MYAVTTEVLLTPDDFTLREGYKLPIVFITIFTKSMVKTLQEGSEMEDGYAKAIDFSNDCRNFYINRKKMTETFKEKMGKQQGLPDKENINNHAVSLSMDRLRTEMASLMDLDLSLMEQLLTLNETIEDIKSRRIHREDQSAASSCFLSREWSKNLIMGSKPEVTQEFSFEEEQSSDNNTTDIKRTVDEKRSASLSTLKTGQRSFDSGYNDEAANC